MLEKQREMTQPPPPPAHLLLGLRRESAGLPMRKTSEPAMTDEELFVVAPSGRVLTSDDLQSRARYADFGIVASALASTMAERADTGREEKRRPPPPSPHRPLPRRRSPGAAAAAATPPRSSAGEGTDSGSVSFSSAWTEASSFSAASLASAPAAAVRTFWGEAGREKPKNQQQRQQQQQHLQPVFSLGASSSSSAALAALAPRAATTARRAADREARRAKRGAAMSRQGVAV